MIKIKKLLILAIYISFAWQTSFASSHITSDEFTTNLKPKPEPSENLEALFNYECKLNTKSLYGSELPTIYQFDLFRIDFEVFDEDKWVISDFDFEIGYKKSLKNTVEQEFLKTKKAVNRGYFNYEEKHLPKIIEYFLKPALGDIFGIDALNSQLSYMNEKQKEEFLYKIESLIVNSLYTTIDNLEFYRYEYERIKIVEDFAKTFEIKATKNNLILNSGEEIQILIKDYSSKNTLKFIEANLIMKDGSLNFTGSCNLI